MAEAAKRSAKLAEEQQKQAEAAKHAEEEKKQAEEAKLAEEQKEAARLAEEQKLAEAAKRSAKLAEEQQKQAEAAKLAEEQQAEAAKHAEEQKKQAEAAKVAEEQRRQADAQEAAASEAGQTGSEQNAATRQEAAAAPTQTYNQMGSDPATAQNPPADPGQSPAAEPDKAKQISQAVIDLITIFVLIDNLEKGEPNESKIDKRKPAVGPVGKATDDTDAPGEDAVTKVLAKPPKPGWLQPFAPVLGSAAAGCPCSRAGNADVPGGARASQSEVSSDAGGAGRRRRGSGRGRRGKEGGGGCGQAIQRGSGGERCARQEDFRRADYEWLSRMRLRRPRNLVYDDYKQKQAKADQLAEQVKPPAPPKETLEDKLKKKEDYLRGADQAKKRDDDIKSATDTANEISKALDGAQPAYDYDKDDMLKSEQNRVKALIDHAKSLPDSPKKHKALKTLENFEKKLSEGGSDAARGAWHIIGGHTKGLE